MSVLCLSFHAAYRCRHAGACCRADWQIDVEPSLLRALQSPGLASATPHGMAFASARDGDGIAVAVLPRRPDGECGFRRAERCGLQAVGGEAMLPSACRHFPRLYLRDGRGTLLTLSHYCPTAAAMLLEERPVAVIEAAPPLALAEPVEGLDARDALPPLLRPGMLMDTAGYGRWERTVVQTLGAAADPDHALAVVAAATDRVRRWAPADGPLADAVDLAFAGPVPVHRAARLSRGFEIVRAVTGPHPLIEVPDDFAVRWQEVGVSSGATLAGPLGRYLAACAFANWVAYRGQGLRSVVEWLRACHDVVRLQLLREISARGAATRDALIEAFRASDYVLVHTVDSQAFGRAVAVVE